MMCKSTGVEVKRMCRQISEMHYAFSSIMLYIPKSNISDSYLHICYAVDFVAAKLHLDVS